MIQWCIYWGDMTIPEVYLQEDLTKSNLTIKDSS